MDKDDKDRQYSPSEHSHRMSAGVVVDAHISHIMQESQKSRETIEFEEVSYGDSSGQRLQIFGAKTLPVDAPIMVYIHGGYWQELSLELSSYMVAPLFKAGCIVVPIGYDIAPKVGMTEIVSQVKKAVGYVLHLAKRRESRGVYLCGHSAGGHLAAMMLAVDWVNEVMVSSSLIKGAMLVSGIYDVRPLVETFVNKPLQMTEGEAWDNSPAKIIQSIAKHSASRRVLVVVAEHDPPSFHAQAEDFNKELLAGGVSSTLVAIPNTDHFDVVEKLSDPDYALTKELIKLLKV